MSIALIPSPGKPKGPCATPCTHPECRELRETAHKRCLICGHIIGYDTTFYIHPDGPVSHAECADLLAEQNR